MGVAHTRHDDAGFVYYIQPERGGLIKVGFAIDPEARCRSLQGGNHENLVIRHTVPKLRHEERDEHLRWAHLRIRGEWFYPAKDLAEFCQAIAGDEAIENLIQSAQAAGYDRGYDVGEKAGIDVLHRKIEGPLTSLFGALAILEPYCAKRGVQIRVSEEDRSYFQQKDPGDAARWLALGLVELVPKLTCEPVDGGFSISVSEAQVAGVTIRNRLAA